MTKRDFFKLLIKLFALYSVILTTFNLIPSTLGPVFYLFDITYILLFIIAIFVIIISLYFLLYKTDKIIDFLKLDKGFDEDRIQIENLYLNNIILLSIIITSGILFIDNIPALIIQTLYTYKNSIIYQNGYGFFGLFEKYNVDYNILLMSGIKILLGILLLSNRYRISKWLIKEENSNNKND